MDKIRIQNLNCPTHSNQNLQFIQINDVLSKSSFQKPLFYCSLCYDHDLDFKPINYLMINNFIQESDTKIIPKWPPVQDYRIIQDLMELTQSKSQFDYINYIIDFFTQFKQEFFAKIDTIQKDMINKAQRLTIDSQQIIQRYQEISKIQQFQQLLNNQQISSVQDLSNLCREFISQIESQKDQNTELLQNLLNQARQFEKNFNFNNPNKIKQQVFAFIDQISFFNQEECQEVLNKNNESYLYDYADSQNNNRSLKISSELIMKLVSNKTNFCSDQFLYQLNQILQKLDPLLQQYSVNQINLVNKEAIDFSKISEQKLNLIEDFAKHQLLLSTQQSYKNEVKDSIEIKQMNIILNSEINFLSNEFKMQFEKLLIDIKPFLQKINFSKIFSEQNNLCQYLKNDSIRFILESYIFKQNFKIITTQFNNQQNSCIISKEGINEYVIKKQNSDFWVNCISNIDLKKDLKYIFRIKAKAIQEKDQFLIGLIKYSNSNRSAGYTQNLSSHFIFLNNCIVSSGSNSNYPDFGIDKKLKGENFQINKESMIEMRVCLNDYILEVTDYPNQQYKLALQNQYLQHLTRNDDLRFYIGIKSIGNQITVNEAKIVKEFQK